MKEAMNRQWRPGSDTNAMIMFWASVGASAAETEAWLAVLYGSLFILFFITYSNKYHVKPELLDLCKISNK